MPAFILKRQILMNLPSDKLEVEVAHSIDFMVERVSRYVLTDTCICYPCVHAYIAQVYTYRHVVPDSWSYTLSLGADVFSGLIHQFVGNVCFADLYMWVI